MTEEEIRFYRNLSMSHDEIKKIGDQVMQAVEKRFDADISHYERFYNQFDKDSFNDFLEPMSWTAPALSDAVAADIQEKLQVLAKQPDDESYFRSDTSGDHSFSDLVYDTKNTLSDFYDAAKQSIQDDIDVAVNYNIPLALQDAIEDAEKYLSPQLFNNNPMQGNLSYWDPDYDDIKEKTLSMLQDAKDMMPAMSVDVPKPVAVDVNTPAKAVEKSKNDIER